MHFSGAASSCQRRGHSGDCRRMKAMDRQRRGPRRCHVAGGHGGPGRGSRLGRRPGLFTPPSQPSLPGESPAQALPRHRSDSVMSTHRVAVSTDAMRTDSMDCLDEHRHVRRRQVARRGPPAPSHHNLRAVPRQKPSIPRDLLLVGAGLQGVHVSTLHSSRSSPPPWNPSATVVMSNAHACLHMPRIVSR